MLDGTRCKTTMDKFKVQELLEICEELGISLGTAKRKKDILEAMRQEEVTAEEAKEAWETIVARKEEKEKQEQSEEKERREAREHALKMKELENASSHTDTARSSPVSLAGEQAKPKLQDSVPPYRIGDDIALFLVNFERACGKVHIDKGAWAERLLPFLPGEAAEVVARLSDEDCDDYEKVKSALLRKYRLSAEAFRQRFRQEKKVGESHTDFAYRLKVNLKEWLKSAEVYGDHDKVLECIALEQYYSVISEDLRLWLQDRLTETNLDRAAQLAEEYYVRRNLQSRTAYRDRPGKGEAFSRKVHDRRSSLPRKDHRKENSGSKQADGERKEELPRPTESPKQKADVTRAFESRRPIVCYNCNKEGHISSNCKQRRVVFASIRESDENIKLLEPYMQEVIINGKKSRALRDSAATMDVAHPSCVLPADYTGECAWIRQVAEEQSVCLPIAKVTLEGPFGKLNTEAAVSANLPTHLPYLFSNKSEQLLRDKGLSFTASLACMALTRSRARELAQKLDCAQTNEPTPNHPLQQRSEASCGSELPDPENNVDPPAGFGMQPTVVAKENEEPRNNVEGSTVTPASACWEELTKVDRETLIAEQAASQAVTEEIDQVGDVREDAEKGGPEPHEGEGTEKGCPKIQQHEDEGPFTGDEEVVVEMRWSNELAQTAISEVKTAYEEPVSRLKAEPDTANVSAGNEGAEQLPGRKKISSGERDVDRRSGKETAAQPEMRRNSRHDPGLAAQSTQLERPAFRAKRLSELRMPRVKGRLINKNAAGMSTRGRRAPTADGGREAEGARCKKNVVSARTPIVGQRTMSGGTRQVRVFDPGGRGYVFGHFGHAHCVPNCLAAF